jgi:hypothetical protein
MSMFRLVALVFTVVVGSVFVKAHGETRQSLDRMGVQGLKAKISEARHRDNSWTTGVQENRINSEITPQSVLANRSSFGAEGTGLEPATGFPAPHFQVAKRNDIAVNQPSDTR